MAAALKLPFNHNLGQAYVIAYKGEPQLQIGWKGFVQLAQRSGQFKTIGATAV
jgi:recombination protein RecT